MTLQSGIIPAFEPLRGRPAFEAAAFGPGFRRGPAPRSRARGGRAAAAWAPISCWAAPSIWCRAAIPRTLGHPGRTFLYNTDDGYLRYDRDGAGAAFPAVVVWVLQGAPLIAPADVIIVA